MLLTPNYNLKKPEGTDAVNIDDLNSNADIIDTEIKKINTNKVDKLTGKQLSTEDYTSAEKAKLAGIAANANNIAIVNSLTETTAGKALDATQGKKLAGDISALNASLTEVKQSDAQKLPLTGGIISGDLSIQTTGYTALHLGRTGEAAKSHVMKKSNGTTDYGTLLADDDANGQSANICIRSLDPLYSALVFNYHNAAYKVYGEHNIAVSQSAPSTALAEGCQHQVY